MGMYNEVFSKCPQCDKSVMIQISQVVLGFGGFDLDDWSTMERLAQDEKHNLAAIINKETFYCQECGYDHKVQVLVRPHGDPANKKVFI